MSRKIEARQKVCRHMRINLWGQKMNPKTQRVIQKERGTSASLRNHKKQLFAIQLQERGRVLKYYGNLNSSYYRTIAHKVKDPKKIIPYLECRLDAITHRSFFGATIFQSRQRVNHRKITVDGRIHNRPANQVENYCLIRPTSFFRGQLHQLMALSNKNSLGKTNQKITFLAANDFLNHYRQFILESLLKQRKYQIILEKLKQKKSPNTLGKISKLWAPVGVDKRFAFIIQSYFYRKFFSINEGIVTLGDLRLQKIFKGLFQQGIIDYLKINYQLLGSTLVYRPTIREIPLPKGFTVAL
uniref:Ribosomal protein S4 n=1 Tax=Ancoracysta twista TaxID=2044563 RepID=A0A2H4R8F2_9EUKA|nr:ribosomal protein S4 [Ancoracysta twista]ATY40923.1 ribosomal protein S4 [Ancoracysta twista]